MKLALSPLSPTPPVRLPAAKVIRDHTLTGLQVKTGSLPGSDIAGPLSLRGSASRAIITATNTRAGKGVFGSSASGNGVEGDSTSGVGVYGTSQTGDGVQGVAQAANHSGVYGKNVTGCCAGFFDGPVQVNGNLTVTGTISSSSANFYTVRTDSSTGIAFADCNAGDVAVGGGWNGSGPIGTSAPSTGNGFTGSSPGPAPDGWGVEAASPTSNQSLAAFAVCEHL